MTAPVITIAELAEHVGQEVTLRGWVYNWRKKGKLRFIILRDGFGYLQCVVFRPEVAEDVWETAVELTQESSLEVIGTLVADDRAPGGFELKVVGLRPIQIAPEYPIGKKDHGPDFLLNHRHLWLRSRRQHAILRVRSELERAIHDFFHARGYTQIDSPILTPAAAEGTSTLFETDYFGDTAFLSQSGQLYLEPAAASLGKVYCFGPTFRAEKSKTRRHLTEFWMVEPEVAWLRFDGLLDLCEEFLREIVARVLDRCRVDLDRLERDISKLEPAASGSYPRLDYADAINRVQELGHEIQFGDDFGADQEAELTRQFDRPFMITRFPAAVKAFYMERPIRTIQSASSPSMFWHRKATARSSAGPNAPTRCSTSRLGWPSTIYPARPTSGTSISAGTAPSPTPASAWESSAAWRGCAGCPTCERRFPFRGC
jgi:asparaginyl-tRNA synthetase